MLEVILSKPILLMEIPYPKLTTALKNTYIKSMLLQPNWPERLLMLQMRPILPERDMLLAQLVQPIELHPSPPMSTSHGSEMYHMMNSSMPMLAKYVDF